MIGSACRSLGACPASQKCLEIKEMTGPELFQIGLDHPCRGHSSECGKYYDVTGIKIGLQMLSCKQLDAGTRLLERGVRNPRDGDANGVLRGVVER